MTLYEALAVADTELGRPLLEDEVAQLAQLCEKLDENTAAVMHLIATFEKLPSDLDDEDVPVNRYEPTIDGTARKI